MNHCETAVVITDDRKVRAGDGRALRLLKTEHGPQPGVIDVCDSGTPAPASASARTSTSAARRAAGTGPRSRDGVDAIAVSFTSGTTGDPKGRGDAPSAAPTSMRSMQRGHTDHTAFSPNLPVDCRCFPLHGGWCFPWTIWPCSAARVSACAASGRRHPRGDARARRRPLLRRARRAQPDHRDAPRRCNAGHPARRCAAWSWRRAASRDDRGHGEIGFDITRVYEGLTEVCGPAGGGEARGLGIGESVGADAPEQPPGRATCCRKA